MMERETCRQKYGKVNPVTDNMMCARAEGAGRCNILRNFESETVLLHILMRADLISGLRTMIET